MMRKSIIYSILVAGIVALPSCKKEETTTTTPSLSGIVIEPAIPYVGKGTVITLKISTKGLYTSDGSTPGTIGLSWQVNNAKRDTLCTDITKGFDDIVYKADTLGSYTVTCYAFASNYYSSSATTKFECIKPDESLSGVTLSETVTIGGKQWTAKNLYNTESGAHFKKAEIVSPQFGRFYTWEEAVAACPAGWHLPSADEWDSLGDDAYALMAPAQFLNVDMWERVIGQEITNEKGFNVIPVGYLDNTASVDKFRGDGRYSAYWTSTPSDIHPDFAKTRYFLYDNELVQKGEGDISSLALSVRCVKD